MLQNLLSLNSTPPAHTNKSPVPSASADAQAGFGRALKDVGSSRSNSSHNNTNTHDRAPADPSTSSTGGATVGERLNNKTANASRAAADDRPHDTDGSGEQDDTGLSSELETVLQSGLKSIDSPVLLKAAHGFGSSPATAFNDAEGDALMRSLQTGLSALASGDDAAALAKNEFPTGQQVPGTVLTGELQFGAKGSAQTLAELTAGNRPGAALQAGTAGIKLDGRNPLDKSSATLPGLANALKEAGNVDAATKELPRSELSGLKVVAAADESLQRSKSDTDGFKDTESLMLAGKGGADTTAVKSLNELALGSLTSTSQTLVNAVKENSNWSKMLSAPTVSFSETMRPNGKVLQALSVTLNPVELGKLELNLRMQQGQVTIDVRTESDQAYRTLLVDQDALVNTLRSLGFKVDGININGPQSESSTQFQNPGQSENQATGEGASGEAFGGQEAYGEDRVANSSEGAVGDEEDRASLNVI